ncbi:MAG TPA: hypothetical protein VFE98_06035 [Candidatus Bathyarchaeia archaeon]|nr:hypothetical protein [Candidatus Bathyarchaeia archaeon]
MLNGKGNHPETRPANAEFVEIRMRRADTNYHGIMIRESVKDQTLFEKMKILGKKKGKHWTLMRIEVRPDAIDRLIKSVRSNLLYEKGVPYYAHFYRDDELIIVFPERVFRVSSPDKKSWREVVSHGKLLGIPEGELDFTPCRFEDEKY